MARAPVRVACPASERFVAAAAAAVAVVVVVGGDGRGGAASRAYTIIRVRIDRDNAVETAAVAAVAELS